MKPSNSPIWDYNGHRNSAFDVIITHSRTMSPHLKIIYLFSKKLNLFLIALRN